MSLRSIFLIFYLLYCSQFVFFDDFHNTIQAYTFAEHIFDFQLTYGQDITDTPQDTQETDSDPDKSYNLLLLIILVIVLIITILFIIYYLKGTISKIFSIKDNGQNTNNTVAKKSSIIFKINIPYIKKNYDLSNHNKSFLNIGRSSDNDIVIDNDSISGYHCRINNQGQFWTIQDNNSTNGTRLYGDYISSATKLEKGQIYTLGDVEMIIE